MMLKLLVSCGVFITSFQYFYIFVICLVAELNITLKNVLKLFEDDGILESYQHSGAKVIYIKDPFNEGPILELIQDVAQFIN